MVENAIQMAIKNSQTFGGWPDPVQIDTGLPDPMDYPLDALPSCVREAATAVSRFVKVPIAGPAVVGLAATATAIGNKFKVIERDGLEHFPTLFFALIAESGERKTPTFSHMMAPLEQYIQKKTADYKKELMDVKTANDVILARIKKLKEKAKRDGANLQSITDELTSLNNKLIPKPMTPRMFTTDVTEQRLFQNMEEHSGAYSVLSSEGRPVIDSIMGKYSGNGRTGDAIYLAGISGDTITRDRVGNQDGPEESAIYDPCLNVCIMVQPDKYMEAAEHPPLRSSGALARIWVVKLPSLVGSRIEEKNEPGINKEAMQEYEARILRLLEFHSETDDESKCFTAIRLSPETAEGRRLFHNDLERSMADDAGLDDVRDITSKIVTQTVKIALLIHLLETANLNDNQEINLDTWHCAQRLGEYHLSEAVRIQRLASGQGELSEALRLLNWIRKKRLDSFTISYICQRMNRPRPNSDKAKAWCEILVKHHWIRVSDEIGSRRKQKYETNPALFSQISQGGE